jgi:hypothetical protein
MDVNLGDTVKICRIDENVTAKLPSHLTAPRLEGLGQEGIAYAVSGTPAGGPFVAVRCGQNHAWYVLAWNYRRLS